MCGAMFCETCRRRSTGWLRINGNCPACSQGVNVMTTSELMEERRQQLEQARALNMNRKDKKRYIKEIEMDIERIAGRRAWDEEGRGGDEAVRAAGVEGRGLRP